MGLKWIGVQVKDTHTLLHLKLKFQNNLKTVSLFFASNRML